jgi:hypothetical protein
MQPLDKISPLLIGKVIVAACHIGIPNRRR